MKNIIDKATTTHTLTYEEIVSLLKDNTCDEYLFKKADQVRMQYVGNYRIFKRMRKKLSLLRIKKR